MATTDRRRRSDPDDPFEERLTFSMTGALYGRLCRAAGSTRTLAEVAREALALGLTTITTEVPMNVPAALTKAREALDAADRWPRDEVVAAYAEGAVNVVAALLDKDAADVRAGILGDPTP